MQEGSADVKLKINRMLLCHMWTPDDSAADMDIGAKTRRMATGSFSKYLDPTKGSGKFWPYLNVFIIDFLQQTVLKQFETSGHTSILPTPVGTSYPFSCFRTAKARGGQSTVLTHRLARKEHVVLIWRDRSVTGYRLSPNGNTSCWAKGPFINIHP